MTLSDLGKDAMSVLRAIAPTLATAVGGPFGGMAAAALTAVLGVNPTTGTNSTLSGSVSQILATASPEDLLKLKQAEEAFKTQMADLGIKEEQLVYADVDSARKMQMTTKSFTPDMLTYSILTTALVCFVSLLFGVIKVPQDSNSAVIFGSVLTFLFTESKSVIAFWLGGVYDSKVKSTDVDLSSFGAAAPKGGRK